MDEIEMRKYAEAHADAVVRGDQAHLMADIVPDALASLAPVAGALPQPTKSGEVQSIAIDDAGKATVRIAYGGDDKTVTVESNWEHRDGRPKLVNANVI